MKKLSLFWAMLLVVQLLAAQTFDPIRELRKYNVIWETPSLNSLGSMPVGNGDIGMNVWVEEDGDLLFYLSKTDAWSENAQLLKLGKVRIRLTPNPFTKGNLFRQELDLERGEIRIKGGSAGEPVEIVIRADANHPLAEVAIESGRPLAAEVLLEPWRTAPRIMSNPDELPAVYGMQQAKGEPVVIDPDSILPASGGRLTWFHRNSRSIWADNLNLQALGDMTGSLADPLLGRIFGAAIEGSGMQAESKLKLKSISNSRKFTLLVYPLTTTSKPLAEWQKSLDTRISEIGKTVPEIRIRNHRNWWTDFWTRSYIFISADQEGPAKSAETVTRGYILQRFMNACSGRGGSPIKFNGSIFTVDTYNRSVRKGFDADFRLWGGPYWFQNTRLPYWSMLQAGDFEMMAPLFRMYMDALPLRKAATKKYYSHDGAFYPETMYFWGTYTNDNYGRNREGMPDGLTQNTYIRYYWTGGLEVSEMMIDYYRFTQRTGFARDTLVPFVTEILTFFDQHWPRDIEGKILFTPAQALETYQTAVDPTPDIAGLMSITRHMLTFPDSLVGRDLKKRWKLLSAAIPEIPLRKIGEESVIAPARNSARLANIENPELYAIFPFRIYGPSELFLDLAIRTYENRRHTMNIGWQHSAIQAACLGLAEEAAALVIDKFSHSDPECRFPAFWGPNYDWSPDQDHGTVAMIALQRMLVQWYGNEVLRFPAWPKEWKVEFRLAGPGGMVED